MTIISFLNTMDWSSISWEELLLGAFISGGISLLIAFVPSFIRKMLPSKYDYVLNCKEINTTWELEDPAEMTPGDPLKIIKIKSTIHIKNDGEKDLSKFSQFKPLTITVPQGYIIKDIEFDKECLECREGKILGLEHGVSKDKRSVQINWTLFKSKQSMCATIYAEKDIKYIHFNKSKDLSFFKELKINYEFPNLITKLTSVKSQSSFPADYCMASAWICFVLFLYGLSLPTFHIAKTNELFFVVENIGSNKQLSNKHEHFGRLYYNLDDDQIEFISDGRRISFPESEINNNLRIKYIKAPVDEINDIKASNRIRASIKIAFCGIGLIGFIVFMILTHVLTIRNNKS